MAEARNLHFIQGAKERTYVCFLGLCAIEVMGHEVLDVVVIWEPGVVAFETSVLAEMVGNVKGAVREAAVLEVNELHAWILHRRALVLQAGKGDVDLTL